MTAVVRLLRSPLTGRLLLVTGLPLLLVIGALVHRELDGSNWWSLALLGPVVASLIALWPSVGESAASSAPA